MNIKHCNYLLAIEEHRTLSHAARALGISQPALSKFLSSAESDLGHTLFERTQGVLMPTVAGRLYLDACRQMLEIRRQTYSSITQLSIKNEETITIGVTPYRGTQMFSEIFPSFYERFPRVKLILKEGYMTALRQGISDGSISLSLGTVNSDNESEFSFASSSYDPLYLCVPPFHPISSLSDDSANFFPKVDIARLSDIPFVLWGKQTTNRSIIDSFFQRFSFHPTVVYEGNNALLIDEMLKTGLGAGFLPSYFCKPKQNRVYFSTWPPIQSFVGVFFKRRRELSEAERYFIYLILKKGSPGDNSNLNIYFNKTSREIIKEFGE